MDDAKENVGRTIKTVSGAKVTSVSESTATKSADPGVNDSKEEGSNLKLETDPPESQSETSGSVSEPPALSAAPIVASTSTQRSLSG